MHQCILQLANALRQSSLPRKHTTKFEVCACDQSVCVSCAVANWFFMYSIDLQAPLLHSCSYSDIERQRCRNQWETIIVVEELYQSLAVPERKLDLFCKCNPMASVDIFVWAEPNKFCLVKIAKRRGFKMSTKGQDNLNRIHSTPKIKSWKEIHGEWICSH